MTARAFAYVSCSARRSSTLADASASLIEDVNEVIAYFEPVSVAQSEALANSAGKGQVDLLRADRSDERMERIREEHGHESRVQRTRRATCRIALRRASPARRSPSRRSQQSASAAVAGVPGGKSGIQAVSRCLRNCRSQ